MAAAIREGRSDPLRYSRAPRRAYSYASAHTRSVTWAMLRGCSCFLRALGWYAPGEGAGLIGAVVGAIVVLAIWAAIAKGRA